MRTRCLILMFAITSIWGCNTPVPKPQKPASEPQPYAIAPSKYGNPISYRVFGREYRVMSSSEGYQKQGMASWYGPKFHGKRTSSGTAYDMHKMTAAHKSLPIPTFVQVTRVDTGKSIIVEVNDRGPFVDDRIIDLSYAAAQKLDMVGSGTAPVIVKALPPYQYLARHRGAQKSKTRLLAKSASKPPVPVMAKVPLAQAAPKVIPQPASIIPIYLQVGAFVERSKAEQMLSLLSRTVNKPVLIETSAGLMHRVKIGPVHHPQEIAKLRLTLADLGIFDPYLVAQAPN